MITKWNDYQSINENLQRARSILRRAGIAETNDDFQKLRKLLATHPGYLGKFTEWLVVNKITYDRLEDLYEQIKDSRLSRPIDEFKTPEEIIDTIVRTTADTAVNQMIHAIPSRAREFLKNAEYCENCDNEREVDCDNCDGDGTMSCEKCEGEAEIECPDCKGHGEKECTDCKGVGDKNCKKCKGKGTYYKKDCPDCDGEGTTECETCNGGGEVECKTCEGEAAIECDKCKGEAGFPCTYCKEKGKVKCHECSKDSDEWKEFVRFLALQAPHKDLIIDFLSKKGGRYSNEDNEWDYSDQTAVEELTETITRLIDLPSIDSIIERLPNEPNLRLIHNDDKVLIVAANYEGVQKYGSSYWCIHQDESTFNDYVYERSGICEQWIMYIKGKTPLVDEKSVMGITYNIEEMGNPSGVEYAHWEDDDDCVTEAMQIIKGLKIDKTLITRALDIFDHEGDIVLKFPEAFLPKIEKMFDDTKLASEELSSLKPLRANASYTERNKRNEIRSRRYQIIEMINHFLFEEYGEWTPKLTKLFTKICKDKAMKIPTTCGDDFAAIAITELYPYFDFDAKDFTDDIFEFLGDNDIDGTKANAAITWLVSNGYNIKPHLKSNYLDDDYLLALYKLKLVTFDDFIRSTNLDSVREFDNEITIAVLNNIDTYINDRRFSKFLYIICDVLSKNMALFTKYKTNMLDLVSKVNKRDDLETILDKIDDDDLEMACARKLLHRKILTKYDVEMKKKMLEKIVLSYKDFK
jgi:hypothetical protein